MNKGNEMMRPKVEILFPRSYDSASPLSAEADASFGRLNIAAAQAGGTSQDLKTGYLVGATPKYQQYGILIGTLTSAPSLGTVATSLTGFGSVTVTGL
jgi:uncharacterized oligopeptide transporter (OPT) family protein